MDPDADDVFMIYIHNHFSARPDSLECKCRAMCTMNYTMKVILKDSDVDQHDI